MRNKECKGYSEYNGEGVEYDCEYEYSGEITCGECIFGNSGGKRDPRIDTDIELEEEEDYPPDDTITLKRIYSTHCQVCGMEFNYNDMPLRVVYLVPFDNNICCFTCARQSGHPYEPRIYKEGE